MRPQHLALAQRIAAHGALAAALLAPLRAQAEPAAPVAHVTLLWVAAAAVSLLAGAVPIVVWRMALPQRPLRPVLVVAAALALAFLFFVGPILVAIGSILVTGRTM